MYVNNNRKRGKYMKGIDISYANSLTIEDLKELKTLYNLKFVILRLGYSTNLDDKVENYAYMCRKLDLPVSFYHFSYATSLDKALKEAEFVNTQVARFEDNPILPIYFDFEYDSEDFYKKTNGCDITEKIYQSFYNIYEQNIDYEVGIYFNTDYFNRFRSTISKIPIEKRWISYGDSNLAAIRQTQIAYKNSKIDFNDIYDEQLQHNIDCYYRKGWHRRHNNWYYRNEEGMFISGWLFHNHNYYYLSRNGKMLTGLNNIVSATGDNELYYFSPEDGHMMRTDERGALK